MDQVDRLLTIKELAGYLVVPPTTINGWCHHSVGPLGFRVGMRIRFRWSDLECWADAQLTAFSPAVSAR